MIWFLLLDLTGLICGLLLFWRRRLLPREGTFTGSSEMLSVIIPARNEAENLPILLASLARQSRQPDEIIVADDDSEDLTARISADFGARVISARERPDGWLGKSWACQQGADAARGSLLLFLDADVELEENAVAGLLAARAAEGGVVSVLPHHRVRRPYEYLSLFSNLIQVAGNGAGMPFRTRRAGLFGPVILIGRDDYLTIGGHGEVRQYVVEDLALGRSLSAHGISDHLYYGDGDVSYRMYGGGVLQLVRGWMKNMAAGASQVPLLLIVLACTWITGCLGCIVDTIRILALGEMSLLGPALLLIALFTGQIIRASRQVGTFNPLAVLIYPLWLLAFLLIFLLSVIFKVFGLKVNWKGRKVDPCK